MTNRLKKVLNQITPSVCKCDFKYDTDFSSKCRNAGGNPQVYAWTACPVADCQGGESCSVIMRCRGNPSPRVKSVTVNGLCKNIKQPTDRL
jgi:hypothetical protein